MLLRVEETHGQGKGIWPAWRPNLPVGHGQALDLRTAPVSHAKEIGVIISPSFLVPPLELTRPLLPEDEPAGC